MMLVLFSRFYISNGLSPYYFNLIKLFNSLSTNTTMFASKSSGVHQSIALKIDMHLSTIYQVKSGTVMEKIANTIFIVRKRHF